MTVSERTTRSADLTRESIIAAAVETFSRLGFSAVSTRALASAAGVNIATLSYHFGNKQGVYEAAVDHVYAEIRDEAAKLAPQIAHAPLREQIAAVVDFARERRAGVRLLTREVLDHGRMTEATEQAHFLPNLARQSQLLSEVVGVPVTRARALLVSGGFLISRFSIQDDDSLREALGLSTNAEVRETVIDVLYALSTRMLGD